MQHYLKSSFTKNMQYAIKFRKFWSKKYMDKLIFTKI